MDKIYYQPNHLWKGQKAVKKLKELSGEKPKTVKQWLSMQAFWQVHLPVPKQVDRPHYKVTIPNEMHQFDLLYMPSDSLYGSKYKYILAGIDAASRSEVTRPLRTKQAHYVAEMIADIYKVGPLTYPKIFQCDNGSEFKGDVTLYTSIPHDLLKSRISNLVHNAFRKKDGSVRYTHIKVTRATGHFTRDINGGGDNMYTADKICKMIEFLIDNIFVQFGGRLFHQVIGIPMGTNCAPLLVDLFLYSYENEFLDNMIRSGHRRLARSFNLCYRYIDDLIVFNNKKFLDYLKEMYPSQLTVEKANKSDHLADYLDLTFIIDSGGKLSTRLYDKRDDFDFHIVNFPYLSSNIPSGPSYGVYISQLIRYA